MKIFKKRKYYSKLLNEIKKGIYINSKKEVQIFFVKYITLILNDFLMIEKFFD